MPIMNRDEHENLLNELLTGDLEHSRKTEILQQLRINHSTAHEEIEQFTQNNTRLQKDNEDLVVSNSKLFRQLGVVGGTQEHQKKEEQKTVSESITLEALEK